MWTAPVIRRVYISTAKGLGSKPVSAGLSKGQMRKPAARRARSVCMPRREAVPTEPEPPIWKTDLGVMPLTRAAVVCSRLENFLKVC